MTRRVHSLLWQQKTGRRAKRATVRELVEQSGCNTSQLRRTVTGGHGAVTTLEGATYI